MKIIKNPYADLLTHTPDPEKLIERAGRTCYKSEYRITEDSSERFIRMIINRGHESVLEHTSATFRIVCDRSTSHQIVRHRIASYSQESQRYCNYSEGGKFGELTFVKPIGIDTYKKYSKSSNNDDFCVDFTDEYNTWTKTCEYLEKQYNKLVESLPPEIARSILPNSTKTEIVMTCNFRMWRHFLKIRLTKHAQPDIKKIAADVLDGLTNIAPNVFADIKESE